MFRTRSICAAGGLALLSGTALAMPVQNPGFELGGYATGYAPAAGAWMTDGAAFVGATDGITPFEGARMLQFLSTAPDGGATGASSDISQIMELSDISGLVDQGEVTADASIWVNRVDAGPTTDTRMGISLYAFDTMPTGVMDYLSPTLRTITRFITDGDISTWERVDVSMVVPAGTRYLGVTIFAQENVVNDAVGPEFAGHFADGLMMRVIPAPASMALLGLGGLIAARRRR